MQIRSFPSSHFRQSISPNRYIVGHINKFQSNDVEGTTSEVFRAVLGLAPCSLIGGYQKFTGQNTSIFRVKFKI